MKVLLIEDETATARAIELVLTGEGFNVYSTDLGQEGAEMATSSIYDIILLDLSLPDMHGYDVIKRLRADGVETPVVVLSAIAERDSKVRSLGFGADDYITKPFHRDELVARIHAVVRRARGCAETVIRIGSLTINLDAKLAEFAGAVLPLTGKEYEMLELLALRRGTTLSKAMFLAHLYGGMDEPDAKIVDVFICKLRKKLAQGCGGLDFIQTVWGSGYVLRDPGEGRLAA